MKMRKVNPKKIHEVNNKIRKKDWFRFYVWWVEKQKEVKEFVERMNCSGIRQIIRVIDLMNSLPVKYKLRFTCYTHEREISATNRRTK